MCYDEGTLLAYLDDEPTPDTSSEIAAHLTGCDDCAATVARLEADRTVTDDALARLEPYAQVVALRPAAGTASTEPSSRRPRDLSWARWAGVAAAAVLVVGLLAIAPVRSAAASLLQILRVNNVQTVTITAADLSSISKALEAGKGHVDLKSLGEVSIEGGQAEPKPATLAQAQAAVDFPVKLPADATGTPDITLTHAQTYRFKLHVAAINKLLQSYGAEKLLPESLDGKTFSVDIAPVVLASYGGSAQDYARGNVEFVGQTRSPQLVVPDGVDAAQLRDVLVNLPFLPQNVRDQLATVDDWQSTLLIPSVDGSARDITIGGTPAVLVSPKSAARDLRAKVGPLPDNATVLWNDKGVVRAVGGSITEEKAIALAKSIMK